MDNNKTFSILICDDNIPLSNTIKEELSMEGYECQISNTGEGAIDKLKSYTYDLVILDISLPDKSGIDILKEIRMNFPYTQVIMLTAQTETDIAVQCIKLGANDFLTKPYVFTKLIPSVEKSLERKALLLDKVILEKEIGEYKGTQIIGDSPALKNILNLASRAAKADVPVLIEGETGTGKELIAKYVHNESLRNNKPFVSINCSSLPDSLFESEVFGHEKGAFTDAKTSKQGLVEISNGGTLFFDEIGELSLTIQPKLLRFLETGEYRRVGGINNRIADCRIIAATNKNLQAEVETKNFRQDLLFRLNVVTLQVPRLSERKSDIVRLSDYFLKIKSKSKKLKILSDEAKDLLLSYNFPGNVRELEHLIERSLIFCDEEIIYPHHFNLKINLVVSPEMVSRFIQEKISKPIHKCSAEEIERIHIESVLEHTNWDRTQASSILGLSKKTLYNKIQFYNLKTEI